MFGIAVCGDLCVVWFDLFGDCLACCFEFGLGVTLCLAGLRLVLFGGLFVIVILWVGLVLVVLLWVFVC